MEVSAESLGPIGREIASRARKGETIVITEIGEEPVKLKPDEPSGGMQGYGIDEGKFIVPDDFDDTSEDIIRDFEGE